MLNELSDLPLDRPDYRAEGLPRRAVNKRPKVTWAEFEQIPCNRCGACCERLWMPSPEKLMSFSDAPSAVTNPSKEWLEENRRFIAWIAALEPTGRVNEAAKDGFTHQYRCTRFKRVEDGTGFCTAYDDRPNACRDFPYGKPVRGEDFEECSYNVEIVSNAWPWRVLRWLVARVLRSLIASPGRFYRRFMVRGSR